MAPLVQEEVTYVHRLMTKGREVSELYNAGQAWATAVSHIVKTPPGPRWHRTHNRGCWSLKNPNAQTSGQDLWAFSAESSGGPSCLRNVGEYRPGDLMGRSGPVLVRKMRQCGLGCLIPLRPRSARVGWSRRAVRLCHSPAGQQPADHGR